MTDQKTRVQKTIKAYPKKNSKKTAKAKMTTITCSFASSSSIDASNRFNSLSTSSAG
jgi:hypothetical protein